MPDRDSEVAAGTTPPGSLEPDRDPVAAAESRYDSDALGVSDSHTRQTIDLRSVLVRAADALRDEADARTRRSVEAEVRALIEALDAEVQRV